ncbi:MAG TPA: helix-turn-helix transcriptional regulator [Usitatibacter sp.]|nr:helix-turn-helix transcriptional regulator [Usitatibacter sp.]
MRENSIDAKHQRMLELLAQGATSRIMARQMGYQEGTMRVYLHNLYRRIGVANKTEAVVWYLGRERSREDVKAVESAQRAGSGDLVGDMALEEDLMAALGVMSHFIGPYGRIWEVAQRIEGNELDAKALERRARGRMLWRALLKGDWAYGKRTYDTDAGTSLAMDSPSDAVLLAALLLAGGYSLAADRLVANLTDKRKAARGLSAREGALVRTLRETFNSRDDHALAALQKVAGEKAHAGLRQLAMVMLFHAHKARSDAPRARQAANAVWAEAEAGRKQLQAMGERPFGSDAAAVAPAKAPAREKAAATR